MGKPHRPLEGLSGALKLLRLDRDMRQGDLARASGVTKSLISLYESGRGRPRMDTLEKLLLGLGADLGDLNCALLRARELGPAAPRVRNPRRDLPRENEFLATERALGEFLSYMAGIAH